MRIFDVSQSELLRACSLDSKIAKEQIQSSLLTFIDGYTTNSDIAVPLYKICTGLYSIKESAHSFKCSGYASKEFIIICTELLKNYINLQSNDFKYNDDEYLIQLNYLLDSLQMLLTSSINSLSEDLLDFILENKKLCNNFCNFASKTIHTSILRKNYAITEQCIAVIVQFAKTNGKCQLVVGKTKNIFPNLLNVINTRLQQQSLLSLTATNNNKISNTLIVAVASCIVNLLGRCLHTDSYNAIEILNSNGLAIVEELFLTILPYKHIDKDYYFFIARVISSFSSCLSALHVSILAKGNNNLNIFKTSQEYHFDSIRMEKIINLTNHLIPLIELDISVCQAFVFLVANVSILLKTQSNIMELEHFLLSTRNNNQNSCFIIDLMKTIHNPSFSCYKDQIFDILNSVEVESPRIHAMIDQGKHLNNVSHTNNNISLSTSDIRHCNYPSCVVSSMQAQNQALNLLKLCAKCKLVAYCSRDHQQKDWKAHKLVCTKK